MEQLRTVASGRCESCGRDVPAGRVICAACEKCNGYSAANWLAMQMQSAQNQHHTEGDKQ